jgi:hypothetical protein
MYELETCLATIARPVLWLPGAFRKAVPHALCRLKLVSCAVLLSNEVWAELKALRLHGLTSVRPRREWFETITLKPHWKVTLCQIPSQCKTIIKTTLKSYSLSNSESVQNKNIDWFAVGGNIVQLICDWKRHNQGGEILTKSTPAQTSTPLLYTIR